MKQTGWYSLKENENSISVFYKHSNRIKSLFVFTGFLAILLFDILNSEFTGLQTGHIIVIILGSILLLTSLVVDTYKFYPDRDFFDKIYGIFPFVKKRESKYSELENIEINEIEKKSFRDYLGKRNNQKTIYFYLALNFKNGKIEYLGVYRDYFQYLSNKIKKIFLNYKN